MKAHSPLAPRAGLTALLLACAACRPQNLTPTLPPDVRVDTYAQLGAARIDVLWVVDNSGSMAPRQENLARNFAAFITQFANNSIDYRLAVTTTDIFRDKGKFVGSPRVISPSTPDVVGAFAENVRVYKRGEGTPYEVGMDVARLAIDTQRTANAEQVTLCKRGCSSSSCERDCEAVEAPFLREGAYLYIVFVTDEDDNSSQDVRYFYRYFETAKGIGNDATVTTAAIVGEQGNTCGARAGEKYRQLSELTGGAVGSICDGNFSSTLSLLASNAVGLKRKFALQAAPNIETIEVRVKYPCNGRPELVAACEAVDRSRCAGTIPEAVEVVCTPRQGSTDGWTYEAANNLIFFAGESVPLVSGQIEIQYYEEGTGP